MLDAFRLIFYDMRMKTPRIVSGIEAPPIPVRKEHIKPMKYPWKKMNVGDSFWVPPEHQHGAHGAKSWAEKHTGFKFVTKTENGGRRVWRVK